MPQREGPLPHGQNAWPLLLFVAAFGAVWIGYIVFVWKLGWLAEDVRPVFRTVVWCAAAGAWVLWQKPMQPAAWLGLAPVGARVVLWTAAAFAAIVAWNVLRAALIGLPADKLAGLGLVGYVKSLVGVFVEELVFRGVIQTRAVELLPAWLAIALTALLFLAVHVPGWVLLSMSIDAGTVVTVFLIGVICGVLRWWTGSLWPAVAAHWANNLGAAI